MSSRGAHWPDRSALFSLVNSNPVIIAVVPPTRIPPCCRALTSVTAHRLDDRPTTAEEWCRGCNHQARARLSACRRPAQPLESLPPRPRGGSQCQPAHSQVHESINQTIVNGLRSKSGAFPCHYESAGSLVEAPSRMFLPHLAVPATLHRRSLASSCEG